MRRHRQICDMTNSDTCITRVSSERKPFFLDVDECVLRSISGSNTAASLSGCHHKCSNYEGGFECSCRDGFLLMYDTKSCQGLVLSLEYDKC